MLRYTLSQNFMSQKNCWISDILYIQFKRRFQHIYCAILNFIVLLFLYFLIIICLQAATRYKILKENRFTIFLIFNNNSRKCFSSPCLLPICGRIFEIFQQLYCIAELLPFNKLRKTKSTCFCIKSKQFKSIYL